MSESTDSTSEPEISPEDAIAALRRNTHNTTNSFRVFAEWLKDNRTSLERLLASQNQVLTQRLDAQDCKLDEIHTETRRTNGRVTDLEKQVELAQALADGREAWEERHEEEQDERKERVAAWVKWVAGGVLIVVGGAASSIGHAIGLW